MATRQQIRARIKQLIAGFFTSSFDYRPSQLFQEELPCSSVYFENGETSRDHDDNPDTEARLAVEITASQSGNIDAFLDGLGNQVEAAIRADNTLSGLVDLIERTGFQYDRDPESFDGTLTLFFNVIYNDED
ncbi:MAG: hypothetical protein MK214_14985 [Thalassotalea sp.]|nr:hypothetical protein [Thalassotalea sp.]